MKRSGRYFSCRRLCPEIAGDIRQTRLNRLSGYRTALQEPSGQIRQIERLFTLPASERHADSVKPVRRRFPSDCRSIGHEVTRRSVRHRKIPNRPEGCPRFETSSARAFNSSFPAFSDKAPSPSVLPAFPDRADTITVLTARVGKSIPNVFLAASLYARSFPNHSARKSRHFPIAGYISPVLVCGIFVPGNHTFSGNPVILFPIKKPRHKAGFDSIRFFRAHLARHVYFIKPFFFGQLVQPIACKKIPVEKSARTN